MARWICRTWTEASINGWTFKLDTFSTREEAEEHGARHIQGIRADELTREYEVYLDFKN